MTSVSKFHKRKKKMGNEGTSSTCEKLSTKEGCKGSQLHTVPRAFPVSLASYTLTFLVFTHLERIFHISELDNETYSFHLHFSISSDSIVGSC